MRCKKEWEFIVVIAGKAKYIEMRKKNGEFTQSIACSKCLPDLEKAIKEFKKA